MSQLKRNPHLTINVVMKNQQKMFWPIKMQINL